MTVTNKPTRIVAIGDPGPVQQQISTALTNEEEFELVDVLGTPEMLAREIRAAEPQLILIDYTLGGQPTVDIIEEIALQFPDVAIVAILPGSESLMAQQVTLAGARAFIIQPFTQINLLSTLRRVRDLEMRRTSWGGRPAGVQEAVHPLHTIAVFGPRGGSGCSTVATNLAVSMKEETDQRILLFEGKLFFGHLGVMLNLRAPNTIADLIPHANNLEEGLVHDVVVEHASGIHVLLAPRDIQVAQGVRPDDLYNILMGVQRFYDIVIIDAGSALTENTVTLLDAADRIILLTNPELGSLQDASRFIQISHSLSYPADKLLLVLNRAGIIGGVRPNDIESALHRQVYAQIPDDGPNAMRSLNRGIPLVFRYPRSPASRALVQLSKSLTALAPYQAAQGGAEAPADKAQRDALLASSRLG